MKIWDETVGEARRSYQKKIYQLEDKLNAFINPKKKTDDDDDE